MTASPPLFGLTVDQWKSTQISSADPLKNILDLVAAYDPKDPAWITIASPEQIKSQWDSLPKSLPLYGVPFAVKDNIDVDGFPTTAACPAYRYIAQADAVVVALLKKAGAIVVGKTNLDQFATGLVGVRSPYGIPTSTFSSSHISGGSSSGSAVVASKGLVPFSLGTDTAGSGRVPAALNNLIGVKPTVGAFSATGVVPACKSLDCVSIFTLSLKDAQLLFSLAAEYDPTYGYSRRLPTKPLKTFGKRPLFAIPSNPKWFGEEQNKVAYEKAIEKFRSLGVEITAVDFSILYELADLLYEGPWVAERYAAIRDFMQSPEKMNKTVYQIIKKAENFTAADFFDFEYRRKDIIKKIEAQFDHFDGMIVPTCPLNPTLADLEAEPILVNSRQGTYTNFVNLSDMSALSIPAGFREDGLPTGVTLLSKAFHDYALLDLAQRFLTADKTRLLGNTGVYTSSETDILVSTLPQLSAPETIPLAVVGGHLSGMALNWQLQKVNATLVKRCLTARHYRLYALPNSNPPKPGLQRVGPGSNGESLNIEIWNVPTEKFADFISMVPAPLGIGSVELEDGSWVKGFICEEIGYAGAKDITKYGGWKKYISHTSNGRPFNTVLVANRGEIAVRIIKTLKKLAIHSVAVYSEPDRYAQHVLEADDAVFLQGTTAAETYLSVRKILDAAKKTGSQAIIPGYGFLSENADFADACQEEGIVFVGPNGDTIRKLGLKHSARDIAEKAGVPLVPGSGLLDTIDDALKVAAKLEYPLMIKSTAGGGGIGLQRVDNDEQLRKAFVTVQRQGMAYFNDSGVFLERFVENARHVEVQVFGDGYGKAISLGERDCSLQRRNQKIIEETPAPRFPEATRERIKKAAEMLASSMKYKCAGTVEFIYDENRDEFYFLEVNARLQVEHPITEMVTGLDLVEWMLYIAADRAPDFTIPVVCKGAAMEARLYAENPVKDFLPSPGQLTDVSFPSFARVDTWVEKGVKISAEYDPTLAKIIVHGTDRADALAKLNAALNETVVSGVITNLDYLRSIAGSTMFSEAKVATKVLDSYKYQPHAIEITAPGSYTSVQDYPGRQLLWHIGVPPSGPMDEYAFRIANKIVGNHPKAPAIECTLVGPSILFHHDAVIALAGGNSPATLDEKPISLWEPIEVKAGQKLVVGKLSSGCRSYIAIRGGIDVPEYLGSRSTFALGNLGGYNGRTLKFGDVLFLAEPELASCTIPGPISEPAPVPKSLIPTYSNSWSVAVTCGPHGAPDFFKQSSLETFFSSEWKVHYNSNRFGVRLIGPKPEWARPDGGEAGLHPSNAHDYVYSLGAINFTGDEPVILTCDGPSLGGFVCAAVVIESEMWKIGQVKPGDKIKFVPVTFDDAINMKKKYENVVTEFEDTSSHLGEITPSPIYSPVLYSQKADKLNPDVAYRFAGDRYILVEYGENIMDLNLSYRVHRLTELVLGKVEGVLEMSSGVRSVLIQYDSLKVSQQELLKKLTDIEKSILFVDNWQVPSRIIKLPLAFEDKKTLAAVDRYKETIRSSAPWLPNNVDFLKEVNGLSDRNDVRDILYQARFLVLGLGDVFLGAPCAVPLDPRHRLLGTKYNPSRSYTPNGTVGIGGMYMCIYTMESPGGYQLVGRTVPIWDKLILNKASGDDSRPWLLSPFDQIEYYPVSEEQLEKFTEEVEHGRYKFDIENTIFDYGEYTRWLKANHASIKAHTERQLEGTDEFARIIQISNAELQKSTGPKDHGVEEFSENAVHVYSEVTGRFWKPCLVVGDRVVKGGGVVILEAMKTEMVVNAPTEGKVVKIYHENGDMVEAGDLVAVIEP
ncbi:bifunctional urea carboxylase/allophanate hydrolase [Sugiyamaella lignohabitans]|uniref:Bifunctional urea carboxylase/allophanate hydrolase n=1 Tax=Sugiyamaella lignohabitans TaxID=796027 RepID=A0A161HFE0_9ASCO|nr:bifunctional urea carboxylase/allophanate hydrolase [Sugiyamaella lignohabitans]ANB14230.1 bifunctional urea carboxylase/allophanate hydrolase [Sugiyamaella lignohabitans]